jgi:hypothetical protein
MALTGLSDLMHIDPDVVTAQPALRPPGRPGTSGPAPHLQSAYR